MLTKSASRVDTVATAADSVRLKAMVAGEICYVTNASATSLQLFGAGTATINAVATATGVAVAAGKTYIVIAYTATDLRGGPLG